uniref:Uncharacterized protein n=1 Tax=Micrurus surinamensis TaxID=129470 RepID=A0A2D4PIQ0_MICSU
MVALDKQRETAKQGKQAGGWEGRDGGKKQLARPLVPQSVWSCSGEPSQASWRPEMEGLVLLAGLLTMQADQRRSVGMQALCQKAGKLQSRDCLINARSHMVCCAREMSLWGAESG